MKQFAKQEQGRSMVEVIGVISIIGLLTMATIHTWGYLNALFVSQRVSDIVLKSVLAINTGVVDDADDLKRFYQRYLPEYNVSRTEKECENKKKKNDCTYLVVFSDLNPKIVSRMVNDGDGKIYTPSKLSDTSLQIQMVTDNTNYRINRPID